jgi:hypothetical protein
MSIDASISGLANHGAPDRPGVLRGDYLKLVVKISANQLTIGQFDFTCPVTRLHSQVTADF